MHRKWERLAVLYGIFTLFAAHYGSRIVTGSSFGEPRSSRCTAVFRSSVLLFRCLCLPLLLVSASLGMVRANDAPASDSIQVILDQAKLIRMPKGTETLVVGNPLIADISVQKSGVMVITGRGTGRTNVIALDSSGTIISESIVQVVPQTVGRLLVQRGVERATYDCAPNCMPTIALGDEDKHFNATIDQPLRRDGAANQGAAAPGKK